MDDRLILWIAIFGKVIRGRRESSVRPLTYVRAMTTATLTLDEMTSGLTLVDAAIDGYLADREAFESASDGELLAEIHRLEQACRRLLSMWNALLPVVERRALHRMVSATSLSAMLQAMLRLSPQAAARRVAAARDLGPRASVAGQALPPILGVVATPTPAADGPDDRSYAQRMHDALAELVDLQVTRNELVDAGAPAQVIITMSSEQLSNRTGYAQTSFGQQVSIAEALRLAGEAELAVMIRDGHGAVLAEHRTRRIAIRSHTLALITRDRGCSFPLRQLAGMGPTPPHHRVGGRWTDELGQPAKLLVRPLESSVLGFGDIVRATLQR